MGFFSLGKKATTFFIHKHTIHMISIILFWHLTVDVNEYGGNIKRTTTTTTKKIIMMLMFNCNLYVKTTFFACVYLILKNEYDDDEWTLYIFRISEET